MKPKLKPPGTERLKLKCDTLLSTSAVKFNLRRYTEDAPAPKRRLTGGASYMSSGNGVDDRDRQSYQPTTDGDGDVNMGGGGGRGGGGWGGGYAPAEATPRPTVGRCRLTL